MHIYLIARGQKDHLKKWIDDLSKVYLPFEYEKRKYGQLQIGVREIKLLEIAVPECQTKEALKYIGPEGYRDPHPILFKIKNLLGKILKLKEIPSVKRDFSKEIKNEAVGLHFLGLKKDSYKEGIEQI